MLQSPTEFDHADALERGIEYAERIDKLLNAATARRDDILQQYSNNTERHAGGFALPRSPVANLALHGRRIEDCIKDHRASVPLEIQGKLNAPPEIAEFDPR